MCHITKPTKMNCSKIHKNIISYLDKELTPETVTEIATHLQSCDACQKLLFEMEKTYEIIKTEQKAEFDPFFYTRLEARMEKALSPKRRLSGKLIPAFKYAIASIAIILSIAAGAFLGSDLQDHFIQPNTSDIISYTDQYANDYYIFEMEDEIIENILLNE